MRLIIRSTPFFFPGSYRLAAGRIYLVTTNLEKAEKLLQELSSNCYMKKQYFINNNWVTCEDFGIKYADHSFSK